MRLKALLTACILAEMVVTVLVVHSWHQLPALDTFDTWFLDVGQGDASFIRGPAGSTVLIDGGPDSTVIQELGRAFAYFDRTIDVLIVTHPDLDHIGGLVDVIDRYDVRMVLMNNLDHDSDAYAAFITALTDHEIPVLFARSDQDILLDGKLKLDVLFPPTVEAARAADPVNNASITVRIEYGAVSMLFTGDIEKETESYLVSHDLLETTTLLKVPHHGSKTSSTVPFLNAVRPHIAIISVGKKNRYGHPYPAVLERYETLGSTILRTDELGTIRIACTIQKCRTVGPKGP